MYRSTKFVCLLYQQQNCYSCRNITESNVYYTQSKELCTSAQGAGVREGGFCPWPESVFSHSTEINSLQIPKTVLMYQDLILSCVFLCGCASSLHSKCSPPLVLQETLQKHLNSLHKQCMHA